MGNKNKEEICFLTEIRCQGNIKKGSKGRFSRNHYKAMDC